MVLGVQLSFHPFITLQSTTKEPLGGERSACACEPEGGVVWSRGLLVGSPMAEWSEGPH